MSLESRLRKLEATGDGADRIASVIDAMSVETEMLTRFGRIGDRRADSRREREALAWLISLPSHRHRFNLPPDAPDVQVLAVGKARGLNPIDLTWLARELEWNRRPIEERAADLFGGGPTATGKMTTRGGAILETGAPR